MLVTGCATTEKSFTFVGDQVGPEGYVPKVDQWAVIVDGSTSMGQREDGERRLQIATDLVNAVNATVPEMAYDGVLLSFGRAGDLPPGNVHTLYGVAPYSTADLAEGLARVELAGSSSPLDEALTQAGSGFVEGKATAVVVVSDGLHMGLEEVGSAASVWEAAGEDLDLYAVQIGDDPEGRELLQKVVGAAGEGYLVNAAELQDGARLSTFVRDVFLLPDSDGDGVADEDDACPDTPKGVEVDEEGCPIDSDGDGVPDYLDQCPDTPQGVEVDAKGCPVDSDGDGVPDTRDACPDTPEGVQVDDRGCPLDSDGDGVADYLDQCPGTPQGVPVDKVGCPPTGMLVHKEGGWEIEARVLFDLNKWSIKDNAEETLDKLAEAIQRSTYAEWSIEIQGHCDKTGPKGWNDTLSVKRAEAVKAYLIDKGVGADRLTTKGFGFEQPRYPNDTPEDRAKNRRVEFRPFK